MAEDAQDKRERYDADQSALVGEDDAPPEWVFEAARALFSWRTVDAELAQLGDDRAGTVDGDDPAALASGSARRLLLFASAGVAVAVEVIHGGRRCEVRGKLIPAPAAPAVLEFLHEDGLTTLSTDGDANFTICDLPSGGLKLRVQLAPFDDTGVVSEWRAL